MKSFKTAITIILLSLVAFVKVFLDILQYDAEIQELGASYWIVTIRDNTLLLIALYLAASLQKDKTKATDKTYTTLRATITSAYLSIKENNLIERFKAYIETDNMESKKAVYKLKLWRKSEKLKEKIKNRENKINAKRVAKGWLPFDEPKTKKLERLRYKLAGINERIENADKMINYVKRVRYTKVSYAILFGEEESRAIDENDFLFHESRHNLFILGKKAILVLLIGAFSIVQFYNVFVDFSPYTIYRMGYSFFSLALSVYLGVADGAKFVRGQMCDVLRRRINYAQGFIERNQK